MDTQYQVKIISCNDSLMWYNNHIGEVFPYLGAENNYYWSREPAGYRNIILQTDGELIKVDGNEQD